MNKKRNRSPSASSDESTTKMCMTFGAAVRGDEEYFVYAIILDPNLQTDAGTEFDGDGFILDTQPTVRFHGFGHDDDYRYVESCVSKSTIYLIESNSMAPSQILWQNMLNDRRYRLDETEKRKMMGDIPVNKSVYSYDLARADFSSKILDVQKSEMQKLPDMHGAKVAATALVTPLGKILVYSNYICDDFILLPHLSEFELYDPGTESWIELPPLYNPSDKDLSILGSVFFSSSLFLISTSNGNYVIDLEENERCWRKEGRGCVQNVSIKEDYCFVQEGLCLSIQDVKSTKDWSSLCQYPYLPDLPRSVKHYIYEFGSYVTNSVDLLDNVDGGRCFGICRVQAAGDSSKTLLIVDVLRFDKLTLSLSDARCLKFCLKELGSLGLLYGGLVFRVEFTT